jgi:hypothetical protein
MHGSALPDVLQLVGGLAADVLWLAGIGGYVLEPGDLVQRGLGGAAGYIVGGLFPAIPRTY